MADPGNLMNEKDVGKVEKGEKDDNQKKVITEEYEREEYIDRVSMWADCDTRVFLIFFSFIAICMYFSAQVRFFPAHSPLDIFYGADSDDESDFKSPNITGSVAERIFIPIHRYGKASIYSVNSDGTGFNENDFGTDLNINHVSPVAQRSDALIVTYKEKKSKLGKSYFYFWLSDKIKALDVSGEPTEMVSVLVSSNEKSTYQFAGVMKYGKENSSVVIFDSKYAEIYSIKSDKHNYSMPRFHADGNSFIYVENEIGCKNKFSIKSYDFNAASASNIYESKNRPEELFLSSNGDILLKILNSKGLYEMLIIHPDSNEPKSIYKNKKEIVCLGWSADGSSIFFIKKSGVSAWVPYKLSLNSDGNFSAKIIKDEKGNNIRF